MSDEWAKYLSPPPVDERLRPQWIAGLLTVAYEEAAYDGQRRDFGNFGDHLRRRIVPLLLEAFRMVNHPVCGQVLKNARERVREATDRRLPDLLRQVLDAISLPGALESCVMEDAKRAARVLATLSDDLLRRQSPLGQGTAETDDHRTTEHVAAGGQARASKDFSSVRWYGRDYTFTKQQAMCVSEWWNAWKNRTPDLFDETVLTEVGTRADKPRLRDIFKDNPAWGTMIQEGAHKGTHRLVEPQEKSKRS